MGLFSKVFEKKTCSVCGGEIGLLGNRKLEDGNLCKNCAEKLSPFFSERRSSTVAQIEEQLAYREQNKEKLQNFHTTRTLGNGMKIMIDEDAGQFVVTRSSNLVEANPDIIDFSAVTGVDIDVDESRSEDKKRDKENHLVSYVPPRYTYSYDFKILIHVNHTYFDEISFRLNSNSIRTNTVSVPESRKPNQLLNAEYRQCEEQAKEIKRVLTSGRQKARQDAAEAAAPKAAIKCPYCGATTVPDENGCCEYCGGSLNG